MLPQFLEHYFWFNDIAKLDLQKNKDRVILQILNFGDRKATDWLFSWYSPATITQTITNYGAKGELNEKSLNYWTLLMNIDQTTLRRTRL